jgi:alkylation response protein AidB-like acyl-CoA dehydrogenase
LFDFIRTDEEKRLVGEAAAFVNKVPRQLLLDMDANKVHYPKEYIKLAATQKLLGLRFPAEYGGRGLGWTQEVQVLEEIGVLGMSLGCLYSLVSIVGEAINAFGSGVQKEKFLKAAIAGEMGCAEGLTEPRSGSDFFGTTTLAARQGDHYVLRGQKRFVVGAEGADFFLVYARTKADAPPHRGISAFLVERGPGVKVEYVYDLLGTRGGGAGRVVFQDAEVPGENLLGEENGALAIFYRMMIPERLTSAAGAIGLARAALEVAARYSTKRKAFGQKIKEFEGVNFKVADSLTRLDAARSLVYMTARAIDRGVDDSRARRLVSECKKFATQSAWEVVNDAMQIMGGIGYTSVYPIEKFLRDCRLALIWTGTNEIMSLIIQHEYYKELLNRESFGRNVEDDAAASGDIDEKVYE